MVILIASVAALDTACGSDDSKCDPGQTLKDSVCVAPAGGTSNSGGSAAQSNGGATTASGGTATSTSQVDGGDTSAGGVSPGEGGASNGGTPAAGGTTSTTPTADLFGIACSADTECTAPVNYCAKMPGATAGYCSQQGCKADSTICPSAWTCFDLSAVGVPNGPNFCTKPNG